MTDPLVARTNDYSASRPGWSSSHAYPDLGLLAAVYKGLYTDNTNFTPVPSCPSGNCTWGEQYTSLGICSKCYDTTDLLTKSCSKFDYTQLNLDTNSTIVIGSPIEYCNYTLPSGQQIIGWNGSSGIGPPDIQPVVLDSAGMHATNHTYFGEGGPYAHLTYFSLIRANWTYVDDDEQRFYYALQSANASECGLDFCVLKYQGQEEQAQFTEQIVDTFVHNNIGNGSSFAYDLILTPPRDFTNRSDDDSNNVYVVHAHAYLALQQFLFLQTSTQEGATIWDGTFVEVPGNNGVTPSSDIMSLFRYLDAAGMNTTMQSLAAALTQRMRTAPGDDTNLSGPGPLAFGTVYQERPHVNVRWAWITLPAIVLFLSAVFLIGTMVTSKKKNGTMLWKGSGLAHYRHTLTEESRSKLANAKSAKEFEKIADGIRVRYEETEDGARFVPVHRS